jgi:NADPH:quinone reductase
MKAILCQQFGMPESLVFAETPSPTASKGKVVISVKSCGVNFPDTLIIQGKYQFKPQMPFSPGGEVAGIVKDVGEGVKHLKVGDRVFSMPGWGGFAEEVEVDAMKTLLMPDGMDFVTGSTVMYAYGTSYHALKDRAKLQAGETLLVMGAAGGVGLAAVELGKTMGAKVIAAASTDEKLELCKQYGATDVINYSKEDLRERIKEITGGKGVDVVYDPVGGVYAEPAFRSIAWKGRYLVVGFAAGDIPALPFNLPLLKGASVVGVFWGAFAANEPIQSMQNFKELLIFLAEGNMKPHIHAQYSLENAAQSLTDILDRKVMGKVVVVVV